MRFATRIGLVTLCAAAFSTAVPAPARAGILVKSTILMPIGDPHYEYDFSLYLQAGSQLRFGDFITIYDVKGLDMNSFTNQPGGLYTFVTAKLGSGIPGGPAYPPGVTQADVSDSDLLYNATWEYISPSNLPPNGVTSTPLFLGEFKIRTVGAFGNLPQPPIETLTYASQTHDANGNAVGFIGRTTPTLVPEPATATMLGLAAASLGLAARLRRRRAA